MVGDQEGKPQDQSDLSCFFEPEGLAVLGSFRENYFGGYVVIRSLLGAGFKGSIYPVNPGYREVLGLKVYPSIREVPGKVDLVIVMINARSVLRIIRECAEKGVRAVIIVADGFAERDEAGARLQEEVVQTARELGMRIMGPNTAGIVNTANGLNPCPYEAGYDRIRKGSVSILSQTGMINPQAFPYPDLRCGISKICDLGNKSDVNEWEVLEYLGRDGATGVISMYLEDIQDGQRFLEACRRVTAQKPVLVVKAGRTEAGARASVSHTGSLAVDDRIFDAACTQGGLLRIDRFGELFTLPKIFASQPLPKGNRLGILTITGGVAVMAIDRGARYGLNLTRLDPRTAAVIDEIFPGAGHMPVDIGPMMAAVKDAFSLYPKILDAVMADENVDCLLSIPWANPAGNIIENYMKAYETVRGRYAKPLVTWVYGPDSGVAREFSVGLEDMGFPVFREPETCVKALGLALRYARMRGMAEIW